MLTLHTADGVALYMQVGTLIWHHRVVSQLGLLVTPCELDCTTEGAGVQHTASFIKHSII